MNYLVWVSHHVYQVIAAGGAVAALVTAFPLASRGRSVLRVIASASVAALGFVVFSFLIVYALGINDGANAAVRLVGSTHDVILIEPLDRSDAITALAMTPRIPPAAAQPN
jgi:NADH:ubiquinone oxidoreductase subunit 4 (subunit M)